MKSISYLLILLFCCESLYSQLVTSRLAPGITYKLTASPVPLRFLVSVENIDSFTSLLKKQNSTVQIVKEYRDYGIIQVSATWKALDSMLTMNPFFKFADLVRTPKEEKSIHGFDLSTNRINFLHRQFPAINGDPLVVSVKEGTIDSTDIDFKNRFISTSMAVGSMTTHATNMATMIAGAGQF